MYNDSCVNFYSGHLQSQNLSLWSFLGPSLHLPTNRVIASKINLTSGWLPCLCLSLPVTKLTAVYSSSFHNWGVSYGQKVSIVSWIFTHWLYLCSLEQTELFSYSRKIPPVSSTFSHLKKLLLP